MTDTSVRWGWKSSSETASSRWMVRCGGLFCSCALLAAVASTAQAAAVQEAGTIASVEGSAEIGRSGEWYPAALGNDVYQGDTLRTGRPGRMRVVFRDDSVINVGDDSSIVVDEQVFDPNATANRSVFELLRGKVRALVSDYYKETGSVFEVQTGTAVAGVRGTEFVVDYDPDAQTTAVVGITGRIEVHSVLDRATRGVYIHAGETTRVDEGGFPQPPAPVEDQRFHQYLRDLGFIGLGRPESLSNNHPLVGSSQVPEPDRAPASVLEGSVDKGQYDRDASSLLQQPPGVVVTGDLGVRF
jgi:FecR protein